MVTDRYLTNASYIFIFNYFKDNIIGVTSFFPFNLEVFSCICCGLNLIIFGSNVCNQFDYYFHLFHIMIMNMRKLKVKIKLV